jgi:4-coumarate--CoA ligase
VVVLAPTHHIYGFIWGVLLPLALGVPAIDADLQALPELLPGDLLVAVPDQWAWLSNAQHTTDAWPQSVKGVTSTAPLHADIHHQLRLEKATQAGVPKAALAQLLHIYGSAETAGLAWRDDPSRPYMLAPGRVRTAANTIALDQHKGLAELAVQDELDWVDAQRFHVVGRLDNCVQVGGHNVSPAWVGSQLANHPEVEHVAVRLCSSAKPQRLKAFVVMKQTHDECDRTYDRECDKAGDQQLRAREIEAWAADKLPWYAMPGSFTYGLALPRSSMGKLCDWPE